MTLEKATFEDINTNYSLYFQMLKIMEEVDRKKPSGSCCGKKDAVIKQFLNNKEKYFTTIEKIKTRKIKPLFKGTIYVSKAHEFIHASTITDDKILWLIEKNYLSKERFDFSEYEEPEKETQETIEEPKELTFEELQQIAKKRRCKALEKARAVKKAKRDEKK